jgi:hypothetical protein
MLGFMFSPAAAELRCICSNIPVLPLVGMPRWLLMSSLMGTPPLPMPLRFKFPF